MQRPGWAQCWGVGQGPGTEVVVSRAQTSEGHGADFRLSLHDNGNHKRFEAGGV